MKELPKVYDPKQVEKKIYDMWMRGGYFAGKADPDKKPFSIVMPPPNVTGQLHMGHALDATPCGCPARITPALPRRSRSRRCCARKRA